jgi:seryl-tRNA synthetase
MLTISLLREKSDFVIERLKVKHFNAREIVSQILLLDDKRRELQNSVNTKQNELNILSKNIGALYKEGKAEEADQAKESTIRLKEEIRILNSEMGNTALQLDELIVKIPNLPHTSVPEGKSSEFNKEIRSGGKMPSLNKTALPHWELAVKYNIIDFELGNKLTGAGFPVYRAKGAKLQRALINFFLDENEKAGYEEILPPFMVNEDSGFGTGQLPDKDGQMYVTRDDFYLIPTAEVPVTNIYRDLIMEPTDFPVKNTAYTPCFRREAGSYGKDVRGLNRLHQFDKVEIVQIQHPDNSYTSLDEMVAHVESLLVKLELPYRIMLLCGGDMGFTSALTYDFEVFSAAQKRWLEVSSVSNFESFQSNRLKLRFRDPVTKKTVLAHTLNGSALALPRVVAALLENNQTSDGIIVPKVLRQYTGFERID